MIGLNNKLKQDPQFVAKTYRTQTPLAKTLRDKNQTWLNMVQDAAHYSKRGSVRIYWKALKNTAVWSCGEPAWTVVSGCPST